MNSKILDEMSKIEIDKIPKLKLADIGSIEINSSLTHEEKVMSFIKQIKNPYCFISNDIPVRIRFNGEGKNLSQSLTKYFNLLKQE